MAVHFITGKLGSGKTLNSVDRIRERLRKGLPVATNLDINLVAMLGRDKKNTLLYRIPDKPTIDDLLKIGEANLSYDESKNGLIVLDECATWFNSRTWNDKTRQVIIDWFLHSRKVGWDIDFLIQNISLVDKQARDGLAEHVVYCRRTDRLNIPLIGTFYWMLTGSKLPLPRIHLGIVKYGVMNNSVTVGKWVTFGSSLYPCYNTKQIFRSDYPHSTYSVLPPYYTHGRYQVPYTMRNIMRITKIYLKKWSRLKLVLLGALIPSAYLYASYEPNTNSTELIAVDQTKEAQEKILAAKISFNDFKVISYSSLPDFERFTLASPDTSLTSNQLISMGYKVTVTNACQISLEKDGHNETVFC
ncbi:MULTISPECIES: zonular occludens toxin domain-containing protein [Pseudoalteromonas]|uniref:Zonular occludens toxin domain-containing protein n=1 Tax=Pseudoalteromonas maricaloris TaxID=184924 RepID=A0A8I2GZY9_9GAMM|nr:MULTISPECIES: zonular occludens toxin domain-containing protein [Pseudoalteromonas]NLR20493.1 hypothetical protein [Pseudoalteromonas maricaloris]RZG15166.1 hypothetical protein EXT47_10475 [Pseudoalteromonas sp. CO342X]WOX30018.1 zonular occludens toxin domain-containing protein [Pseudoalteromonas maricaloris]